MGDAYPELDAGRDSVVQVVRSEEERFDAVLTDGLPASKTCWTRPRAAAAWSLATRRSACTTPTACPSTSSRTSRVRAGTAFDTEGFERAMEASARRRAPAAPSSGRAADFAFASGPRARRARGCRRRFEGYDQTTVRRVIVLRSVRRGRRDAVDQLRAGESGFVARSRRRSISNRAARSPTSAGWNPTAAGARHVEVMGNGRACRVSSRPRRRAARCAVPADVEAFVDRAARRHAPQPHGHPPAPRGASPGARAPTSSRPARSSRPDRLRFDFVHFTGPHVETEIEALERLVNAHVSAT
jgi:hypothetical protein